MVQQKINVQNQGIQVYLNILRNNSNLGQEIYNLIIQFMNVVTILYLIEWKGMTLKFYVIF